MSSSQRQQQQPFKFVFKQDQAQNMSNKPSSKPSPGLNPFLAKSSFAIGKTSQRQNNVEWKKEPSEVWKGRDHHD
jgi:hypothetical protein